MKHVVLREPGLPATGAEYCDNCFDWGSTLVATYKGYYSPVESFEENLVAALSDDSGIFNTGHRHTDGTTKCDCVAIHPNEPE